MAAPLKEITLRKYERPRSTQERELFRRICLSLGVLQPNDRRDTIVDVLHALFRTHARGEQSTLEELVNELKTMGVTEGLAASNLRRHLRRLAALHLVERSKNRYRFTEGVSPVEAFSFTRRYLIDDVAERIEEYLRAGEEVVGIERDQP
ncbi:MAG: hypothetical protein QF415_05920 [Candidatus Undinarchaeales archaeon]|jgi:DNA-binding IclR family transcriptional regulator|nr:hypothetical protein [Candidatus Undinarchaeales archaeon]MDP7491411.1 hypothetical protein [Candidatus Undinarchaeales archaeon]